jgi:hypothetical protein
VWPWTGHLDLRSLNPHLSAKENDIIPVSFCGDNGNSRCEAQTPKQYPSYYSQNQFSMGSAPQESWDDANSSDLRMAVRGEAALWRGRCWHSCFLRQLSPARVPEEPLEVNWRRESKQGAGVQHCEDRCPWAGTECAASLWKVLGLWLTCMYLTQAKGEWEEPAWSKEERNPWRNVTSSETPQAPVEGSHLVLE